MRQPSSVLYWHTGAGGRTRSLSPSQTSGVIDAFFSLEFESKDLLRGLVCVRVFASVLSHQDAPMERVTRTGLQVSSHRRVVLQCPALEESNRRPEVCATMPHSLRPMHGASYWGEARSTHTPARTDSLSDRELAEQRLETP